MPVQTQTPEDLQRRIDAAGALIAEPITNLYSRWQDEREYEDINAYGDILAKLLPEEFTYVKMTKSPFAVHFRVGDQVGYMFFRTQSGFGWQRKIPAQKRITA